MRQKNERKAEYGLWKIIIVGAILLVGVQPVQASLITIEIEAEVSNVSDPAGYLEGKISSGSLITGQYIFESTMSDSDSSSSGGEYWAYTQPSGFYLYYNGLQFETDTQDVQFAIGVINDYYDRYQVNSFSNVALENGTSVNEIIWGIEDSTGTVFESDTLPLTAPVLGDWDYNQLSINGGPRESDFTILATVTNAEVVPEPSTLLLMALGGTFLRRRS